MSRCEIPVSIGELWDKYTILMIKNERIEETEKLRWVQIEMDELRPFTEKYALPEELRKEMYNVNSQLWDLEDKIRFLDNRHTFDKTFIDTSRQIYVTNDKRYEVKKKINVYHKSNIMEVKSYHEHTAPTHTKHTQ